MVFTSVFGRLGRCRRGPVDKITVQILSDLHLEAFGSYETFAIPRNGRYLLLAGDVGKLANYERLYSFLERQCNAFEHVFWVLGNHEFYGLSREAGLQAARRIERETGLLGKLTVLHRSRVDLDDKVTLLGCTLQSHIPAFARGEVGRDVQDFRQIKDWTVDDHNKEHEVDVAWLRDELDKLHRLDNQRIVLVATHHAPVTEGTSDPRYEGNARSTAFASHVLADAQSWAGIEQVKAWTFGHTHWCCDFDLYGMRLVANQHGYFPRDTARPTRRPKEDPGAHDAANSDRFDVGMTITLG